MTAPVPYVTLPGTARDALDFYADVFGGRVELATFADFGRDDGPADAVAHGALRDGPVALFASDAGAGEPSAPLDGVLLALLGTDEPDVLHRWFDRLAEGGTVLDPLAAKPWGAADGQVTDRFGLRWLVGYEPAG